MIGIASATYPSAWQFDSVFEGMRNPYDSWARSDSTVCEYVFDVKEACWNCDYVDYWEGEGEAKTPICNNDDGEYFVLGPKDLKLAKNLINSGVEHAKFLRQLPVIMNIKAPLYWWKQMDQYKINTTTDSCSTMHTLTKEPFSIHDFSFEYTNDTKSDVYGAKDGMDDYLTPIETVVSMLNQYRNMYLNTKDDTYWYAINELLPQSFNQMRTWSANYAVLFNICAQRAGHPLQEWETFISYIVDEVPYFRELCFDKLCQVSDGFRKMYEDETQAE